MVKCNACGGTFDPLGADGVPYFHACPPLSAPELAAAVTAGRVVLPPGETADDAVQRRTYRRANARDENVPSTAAADSGRVKLVGAGVTDVAPKQPPVVIVP